MNASFIAGAAVEGFGKFPDRDAAELGAAAVLSLLRTTGIDPGEVDAAYVGNVYGGSLLGQRVLQRAGVSGPTVITVENACASGGSAVFLGAQAVRCGAADCVVVVGTENLTSLGGGTLPMKTNDQEIRQGLTMPAAYAMRAQRYIHDFGASIDDLARVSTKNRRNGADNPRAHFQKPVQLDEIRSARPVADPLTLLHCCPNTDGAAAVLLCSEPFLSGRRHLPRVRIAGAAVKSGRYHTSQRDVTYADITARTASTAFEHASITPADVDLVELHDAFTIAELIHLEALGIAERGKAYLGVGDGLYDRGGAVAVNPGGGLLSRGHPVGATGVAQICEAYWQLSGQAEAMQVPGNPRVALTHVTGGGISGVDNGACAVHILAAE